AAAALPECLVGILDLGDAGHGLSQSLEALHEEGLDDPGLGLEVVVDPHGSDVGGGGDPADRQSVGALGLEDLGGGGEERRLHPRTGSPGAAVFPHTSSVLKYIVL